jgi:zinc D-Ala-D-Ala carboxypeptidase
VCSFLLTQPRHIDHLELAARWSLFLCGKRKLFLVSFLLITLCVRAQPIDKNYLLGRFNPETDSRFIKITTEYSSGSAKEGYLRKETLEAFSKMFAAAKKDGITLTIISATRNFDSQKRIWENKWTGKTLVGGKDLSHVSDSVERAKIILNYSSMPGSSRHHWGTDMDLNSLENSYFESGEGQKIYDWLQKNAASFGFCQPYTSKSLTDRTGYEEERWHWSYLPLSTGLLKQYVASIKVKDIKGFKGCSTAKAVRIIENYVDGVSCK